MKILNNFEIVDLSLILKNSLIIGDLQLGYEGHLQNKGVLVPQFQLEDIMKRLKRIFSKVNVKRVILNGDIKHEFGTISDQEWRNALKLIDFLSKNCDELVLLKGNHDRIMGPIAEKRKVLISLTYV